MKKRKKKPAKPANFNKIAIVILVVIAIGAFLLFSKNGGKGSSSCAPAPEGCEYRSDDRVSNGELVYPCGILSCNNYVISCTQGEESTQTIQKGKTKVIAGLPIQVGEINNVTSGLFATVVFANGGLWTIYEGSLPYKTPRFFTINNQLYSIEPLSLSKDSLTLTVFCGKK